MCKKKTPVRHIRLPEGKAHALRMPLDAQNGKADMDEGLCHSVRSALDDRKILSGLRYALMMSTVDGEAFSIEGMEKASFLCAGKMDPVMAGSSFMLLPGGKILTDPAPEKNVDELHALTDAEDRKTVFQRNLQKAQLKAVQQGINGTGALILLMKKGRINVASARKDQGIEGRKSKAVCGHAASGKAVGIRRGDTGQGELAAHIVRQRMTAGSEQAEGGEIVLHLPGRPGDEKTGSLHVPDFLSGLSVSICREGIGSAFRNGEKNGKLDKKLTFFVCSSAVFKS